MKLKLQLKIKSKNLKLRNIIGCLHIVTAIDTRQHNMS